MGWACNMYGRCEVCIQKFGEVKVAVGRCRQTWGINANTDLRKIRYEQVDRIKQAHRRFQWLDLVNKLNISMFHERHGLSGRSERL